MSTGISSRQRNRTGTAGHHPSSSKRGSHCAFPAQWCGRPDFHRRKCTRGVRFSTYVILLACFPSGRLFQWNDCLLIWEKIETDTYIFFNICNSTFAILHDYSKRVCQIQRGSCSVKLFVDTSFNRRRTMTLGEKLASQDLVNLQHFRKFSTGAEFLPFAVQAGIYDISVDAGCEGRQSFNRFHPSPTTGIFQS